MLLLTGTRALVSVLCIFLLHHAASFHVLKQIHVGFIVPALHVLSSSFCRKLLQPQCPSLNHTSEILLQILLFLFLLLCLVLYLKSNSPLVFWILSVFWTFNSAFEYFLKKKKLPPNLFYSVLLFVCRVSANHWVHSVWVVPSLPFSFYFFSLYFPSELFKFSLFIFL